MKVRIERSFPMPAGADATWAVLSDIEAVAGCMPGAKVTEKIDATHYKGTVSVRLGPANLSFRGEIEVKACDPATRTLQLSAKGTDTTGSSVAAMDLTARVEPAADGTSTLVGNSEASVGGKAAAFGNRMMDAVSDQILKQFAANFAARVSERNAGLQATVAESMSDAAGNAGASTTAALSAATPSPVATESAGGAKPAAAAGQSELNAFALLWAIVRDWFRGLLSKKPG